MEPTKNNVPNSLDNSPAGANTLGNSTSNNSGSVSTSPFNNSSNTPTTPATTPTSVPASNPIPTTSSPVQNPSPKPTDTTPAFMGMNTTRTSYNSNPAPAPKPAPVPVSPMRPAMPTPALSSMESQMPKPHPTKIEFEKDSLGRGNTAFTPTETKHSSHKMLWFMILFTIVFLALIAGGAYWYMKVYSPEMLTNEATTTDTTATPAQTFPNAIHPITNTAPNNLVNPTTSPKNKIKEQTTAPFSSSDQDKVSAYIKANINRLSPYKSSAGYVVSDITFDGPDRAIVVYGNSTRHYSAVAVSYIDSAGNVKVTSFTILEK